MSITSTTLAAKLQEKDAGILGVQNRYYYQKIDPSDPIVKNSKAKYEYYYYMQHQTMTDDEKDKCLGVLAKDLTTGKFYITSVRNGEYKVAGVTFTPREEDEGTEKVYLGEDGTLGTDDDIIFYTDKNGVTKQVPKSDSSRYAALQATSNLVDNTVGRVEDVLNQVSSNGNINFDNLSLGALKAARKSSDPRIQVHDKAAAYKLMVATAHYVSSDVSNSYHVVEGMAAMLLIATSDDGVLSFNMDSYNKLDYNQKKKAVEFMLSYVADSNQITFEDPADRNRVYNFIRDQGSSVVDALQFLGDDTRADFVTAKDILEEEYIDNEYVKSPAVIIATVLGIISLIVFIGLSISMVMDISYMAIPVWRGWLDARKSKHKGYTRPLFVSYEAYKTMQDVDAGKYADSSYLLAYFRARAIIMVLIALCLTSMMTGGLLPFITMISQVFYGVK
jgi:hypothetical protein